jgi:hypothetical protein
VEISAAACNLAGEKHARRLIRSIVDDHQLADWVSLRVNRLETPFKQRWTVSRYDDSRYSNHERTSLNYKRFEIMVSASSVFFRQPEIRTRMNHVAARLVKHEARPAPS